MNSLLVYKMGSADTYKLRQHNMGNLNVSLEPYELLELNTIELLFDRLILVKNAR